MLLHSGLCQGSVRHRRHLPQEHHFQYRTSMVWLDLDEIPLIDKLPSWSTGRFSLTSFRRQDYLDPGIPDLKTAVYRRLEASGLQSKMGRVVMLAHLRNWGFCFNPVVFYFCFDRREVLYAIVAEINNTPWDERYAYVLPVTSEETLVENPEKAESDDVSYRPQTVRFDFDKAFHVSPFMPMNLRYQWRFRLDKSRIFVHMKLNRENEQWFDASLALERLPLDGAAALRASFGYPMHCLKVLSAIYWQALRLWLKKVPFYTHPKKQAHPKKHVHPKKHEGSDLEHDCEKKNIVNGGV
ncbi:DUF1365 domain-containing protein [Hahella ganghwensis]|uniref:DUF1365 domain-containing protein n=1 Tax=Hahella ganghwensis TaxID=286420 RepID=UPI00037634B8|nr:DUF1365 domain-containing protein [Hahella ganghwensis]